MRKRKASVALVLSEKAIEMPLFVRNLARTLVTAISEEKA
jgi:hypothetical protein